MVELRHDTMTFRLEELLHLTRLLIQADHHAGEVEAEELGEPLLVMELLLSEVLGLNLIEFRFITKLIYLCERVVKILDEH